MNGMLIDETGEHIADARFHLHVEGGRHQLPASEAREFEAQCRSGKALSFYGPDGWLVVTLRPFGDHLELFVLLAVARRHGAFERLEPAVQDLARALGARTIAFESRRRGWARRLDSRWQRRGALEFTRNV